MDTSNLKFKSSFSRPLDSAWKMKQFTFMIILVLIVENVEMLKEFKIKRLNFDVDPEFFKVIREPRNKTHDGAIKINILRDLPNLHFQMILKAINSNIIIFNKTINFCFFRRQKNSNIMFRLLFANVASTVKFKIECPFKKGVYEIEARPFETAKTSSLFLPGYIPINEKILFNPTAFTEIKGQVKTIFNSSEIWRIVEVDD
ncbi:unnamed protein product [Diamesa hyperborea]